MSYDLSQSPTGGIRFIDSASGAVASQVLCLSWNVARAPTNTVTVGTIPANARITRIDVQNTVVSNAVTTATVSVGKAGGTATFFTAAQDIKTAIGNFSPTLTAGWAPSATSTDISCTYTETGGASSAGTATVCLYYCVL